MNSFGEDAGCAYDATMTPFDEKPNSSGVDNVDIEVICDLIELDKVRARLGLIKIDPKTALQNALWGGFGKIAKIAPRRSTARGYRTKT